MIDNWGKGCNHKARQPCEYKSFEVINTKKKISTVVMIIKVYNENVTSITNTHRQTRRVRMAIQN